MDTLFVSNNDGVIHDYEQEVSAPEIYPGVPGTGGEAGVGRAKAAVVARELDIGESLLHNWLARYRLRNGAAALQAEQAAELTRLKRLLAQREEEVAILKKAAAYFARESR